MCDAFKENNDFCEYLSDRNINTVRTDLHIPNVGLG